MNHGLAYIVKRGETQGDSLYGKVNGNKLAVAGHSLGGGATIGAARKWPEKLSVGIPLHPNPFPLEGRATGSSVPLLYFGGTSDRITSSSLIKSRQFCI